MKRQTSFRDVMAMLTAVLVLGAGALALSGCGGEASETGDGREDIHLVYVNWVEGMAMAHVMNALLQDSLNMDVEMSEVTGGGTAFTSVASDNADVFVEAWLPVTHIESWKKHQDQLVKIGKWYERTSLGLATPAYTDIHSVEDLARSRDALNGEIHGIESGAVINQQTRDILANHGVEGFKVVAASGPATWTALQRAIQAEEPIVVTAWKPHWKWGRFDIRYIEGTQTGQSPVMGEPEDIFVLAQEDFAQQYPDRVVQFFENVSINDEALGSLMQPFRPESNVSDPMAAAREWIQNHRSLVDRWVPEEEQATASDGAASATAASMR